MHNFIRAVIGILLLLLIFGCSSARQPVSPKTGGSSMEILQEDQNNQNVTRYCATDDHAIAPSTYTFTYSPEGIDAGESTAVDCIAATFWQYSTSEVYHNYVLTCDTKYKWDDDYWNYNSRCRVIRTTPAGSMFEDGLNNDVGESLIRDPDGCDLITIGDSLFAWIWNNSVTENDASAIYGFEWEINTAQENRGTLEEPSSIQVIINVPAAHAIAVVTTTDDSSWHIIFCDRGGTKLYYLDQAAEDFVYHKILIHDFGLYGPTPFDVCVTKYADDAEPFWNVYVGVHHPSDRSLDWIECFHWDGTDYSEHETAEEDGGYDMYFPGLIAMDVRSFDDHDEGSVCVLMLDVDDKIGYRLRQINFGYEEDDQQQDPAYFQFDEEFDSDSFQDETNYPNSKIVLAESFGMAKMYVSGIGSSFAEGNFYYISDRDPDLIYDGEFDDFDGKNVKAWRNPPFM